MKIDSLVIQNFRGISRLEVEGLGDTIIVAGQNGSGKSCIFDAIRLLKTTYGGYQQNEWQHFFGEFQIQLQGGIQNLRGLFNDTSKQLLIDIRFLLRDEERKFILENKESLLEETIWQTVLPEAFQWGGYTKAMFANQFRERRPGVLKTLQETLPILEAEIAAPYAVGRLHIDPNRGNTVTTSHLLQVIFTNYKPRQLGVIDYHGAQRHYGRELVQGINLSLDQANQRYSQHTLFNYNNKYNNVKSEMAGDFIKDLLAEKAGPQTTDTSLSLTKTLQELFVTFFPEKTFVGPRPTLSGSLEFPVRTASGSEHDLDELSAGEKEILYGYLRIRSSAPSNSIILLDEPELHLNPRLIRRLPEFYKKHLGEVLKNQIWMVTHSDALIREAIGKSGFNVLHMSPCGSDSDSQNQLKPLSLQGDIDFVLSDLIGDLAAYRPGGKGLIFEGGGDTEFDKHFVSTLFADELRGINLISGSNKARVRVLHEVLETAYISGNFPTKFYAILDRDTDSNDMTSAQALTRHFWDVYHIENYLLEEKFIADVSNSMQPRINYDATVVKNLLRESAREVIPSLVRHKLQNTANDMLVQCISIKIDPNGGDIRQQVVDSISRSLDDINASANDLRSGDSLRDIQDRITRELEQSLLDDTWKKRIPGRDILKRFINKVRLGVRYEVFRNLIVSRMRDAEFKPPGINDIIQKIASD